MKLLHLIFVAALASTAAAQQNRGLMRTVNRESDGRSTAQDADARLRAARTSLQSESARLAAERPLTDPNAVDPLKAKAAEAVADRMRAPDPAEVARSAQTERALQGAMRDLSSEGKMILAQSQAARPTTAPGQPSGPMAVKAAVPVADPQPTAAPGEPKPMPMKPASLEDPAAKGKDQTVIKSDALYFDANGAIAIFVGNVEVKHPQFYITCEELEVHTNKEEPDKKDQGKAGAKAGDAPPAAADPAKEGPQADGIRMAIAKGPMVVIEKLTEKGDVQVGICRHATYIGATEEIIMRDYPQVQRGDMLDKATDPSTKMILKPSGDYKREGKGVFEMLKDDKKRKPSHIKPQPVTAQPAQIVPQ
jgi:lipopolysaccharide export system protein LptA